MSIATQLAGRVRVRLAPLASLASLAPLTALLTVLLAAPPLAATASAQAPAPAKPAGDVIMLDLVLPGAGHVYARDTRRGLLLGGLWVTSGALAFNGTNVDAERIAAVACIGTWIYAVADARPALRRAKARETAREQAREKARARQARPIIAPVPGARTTLGLRVTF